MVWYKKLGIRKYSAFEMLEFWETFKQAMKKLIVWLVRLWYIGVDGISLTTMEAGNLHES